MIRKYDDNTQLTAHFNAREFKCKCSQPHDFELSDELVLKLEQLYEKLNCSKIIVTSGFRCLMHDKSVGGSGTGQHTKGTAADVCCYGQDGNPIDSRIVSCAAQDIGFNGIANIDESYQFTHVDVRQGKKWYGNEVYGNGSVTEDFYTYYNMNTSEPQCCKYGIDVSAHNGDIDWEKVGTDFAILRSGYGRFASQKDLKFETNYTNAKRCGIPVGTYWYSYAMTPQEAVEEADLFLSVINGKQFEYPVFYDVEESAQFELGKTAVSAIIRAFLERVESAGYFVGLYTSYSALVNYIEDDIKSRYAVWLAHWTSQTYYSGAYGIWQNGCKGNIQGIFGDVDTDICYVDYPSVIISNGLNGYSSATEITTEPTPQPEPNHTPTPVPEPETPTDKIAVAVIVDGKKYGGELYRLE